MRRGIKMKKEKSFLKMINDKVRSIFQAQPVGVVILAAALVLGLSSLITNSVATDQRERKTGTVDLSELITEDGDSFNQDEYKDKNLIITFTRSTCPYCDDQAVDFEYFTAYHDFEHYYIPFKESYEETKDRLVKINAEHQILIDKEGELAKKLNIEAVPTSIIKRAGEEEFEAVVGGILSDHDLERLEVDQPSMSELLGE